MSNSYRKFLVPATYVFAVIAMVMCVIMILSGISKFINDDVNYKYTLDNVFDDTLPVNAQTTSTTEILRPYVSDTVKIGKNYYDKDSNNENQESAIILYENTYMQNTGVDYVDDNDFDVIAIADGEIISIEDSQIYGKIITIKHTNNFISVYSNITDILVNTGYKVSKGEIIASSTKSILNEENSALHFEVYYKNKVMNPETLYTLSIEDFQ